MPQLVRDEIDKTNEKFERRLRRWYNDDFRISEVNDNYDNKNDEFINKKNYFLTLVKRKSKRNGIATECCEKRCTLAYLRTYCCAGFQLPSNKSNLPTPSLKKPNTIEFDTKYKNNLPKSKSLSMMPFTYSENNEMETDKLQNSNRLHKEFEILNDDAPVFTYEESPYHVLADQPINLL